MLNRLMTSRRVRGFLLTVVILSAIVAIVSVFIPFNRRRDAINTLGEQSLSEATSLALSLEYYNGLRIQSLIDYPSETAFYQNLCAFLSRAKDTLSYDRAYILYRGLEGRIAYLADADYGANLQEGVDYHGIGAEYSDDRYTSQCRSILESQFDGRRSASFVPDILDGSYITTYLPIHDTQGQVIAVLGVDARLGYSDFAQYGPINFERTATIAALLFLISLVLFVLCMDKGLTEEEKETAGAAAAACRQSRPKRTTLWWIRWTTSIQTIIYKEKGEIQDGEKSGPGHRADRQPDCGAVSPQPGDRVQHQVRHGRQYLGV